MQIRSGALVVFALAALFLAGGTLCAQGVPAVGEVIPSRDRSFRIPFRVDPSERMRLSEIQLYVSTDSGQSWRLHSNGQPDQEFFPFTARTDGEYWFAVRTVDREGRQYPPTLSGVAPGLRVHVDTTPPEVSLRGLNPVGDQIGVEWEILDENLDPRTLRLEFRGSQGGDWFEVGAPQETSGKHTWRPGQNGPIQIRLRVLDQAGNEGLREITLGAPTGIPPVAGPPTGNPYSMPNPPSGYPQGYPPSQPAPLSPYDQPMGGTAGTPPLGQRWGAPDAAPQQQQPPRMNPRRSALNVQLVNSTRFQINYSADEVGKSGLSSVALYYTNDGINWHFYGEDDDRQSPFDDIIVNGEGQYGFILVARSGAGVGDDPPAPGDPPQITIEVDITPPDIRFDPPEPGTGPAAGILSITWSVYDINLDSRSICLYYSENAGGPWKPIVENIENAGRYQWKIPKEVPFQFYVRLEAKDRAGNIGRVDTPRPVIVDLVRPRIRILKVEPNGSPLSVSVPGRQSEPEPQVEPERQPVREQQAEADFPIGSSLPPIPE